MAVFRRPATVTLPSDDNDDRPASDNTSAGNTSAGNAPIDNAPIDNGPADNADNSQAEADKPRHATAARLEGFDGDYARVPTPAAAAPAARQRAGTPVLPSDPVSAQAPLTPKAVYTTIAPNPGYAVPAPKPVKSPTGAAMPGEPAADKPAAGERAVHAAAAQPAVASAGGHLGYIEGDGADNARRWRELMVAFVDGPSESVDAAQALVSDELAQVVRVLEGERDRLRTATADGPSTEDLRVALRGLRTLSERLHAIA